MKKLMFVLCLMVSFAANSQNFKEPKKYNKEVDTTTTFTYTIGNKKDTTYTVYCNKNGSYYIYRLTRRGGIYKYYLPQEIQIQMAEQDKKRNNNTKNKNK